MQRRTLTRQNATALLSLIALLCLLAAQLQLQRQHLSLLVGLLLLLGLGLWAWSIRRDRPAADELGELQPDAGGPRLYLLLGSLLSAAIAWLNTDANLFRAAGVIPWIITVILWFAAWWPQRVAPPPSADQGQATTERRLLSRRRVTLIVTLLAIMALGAFFRFYQLSEIPRDPTSDHAEKVFDVQDVLDGQRPIFFVRNTGREPAQFYITYGLIKTLNIPANFNTLKFGTSLLDMLAILAVFLLAAELAGTGTGLMAAALYSFSKWPIAIARMGLRFPYAPLPTALVLWTMLRYMRRGDRRDVLLCGLFIGLGLYGYSPFRIVVLVVPLVLLLVLLFDRRRSGRRLQVVGDGLLVGATAALVFLPLGHFMLEQPDLFWYRAATRAANAERQIGEGPLDAFITHLPVFLQNNLNALLAFNWRGDSTIVNAVRFDPFLDPVMGAALLAAVVLVLYQIVFRRSLRYAALLLALPILMLASTLSIAFPVENPSINRMGAATPVIFTFAALPLVVLAQRLLASKRRFGPPLAGLALLALLAFSTHSNYQRYFIDYPPQYNSFVPNTSEVVAAIKDTAELGADPERAYIISYPHWLDTRNVGIGLGLVRWGETHSVPEDQPLPEPDDSRPLLFVIHREDMDRLEEAQQRWPRGTLLHIQSSTEHKDFYLFVAPGRSASQ